MTPSISQLVGDETLVALTYRQELAPIEGSGARIHPPTYPVPRPKNARKDEPRTRYDINEYGDGTRFCDLDTVQSQANRMEASYRGALADLIPRHAVEAGGHRVDLTELPHRLADASIRATALAGDIRVCFESFAAGDAVPLARLGPTSLVYGAWDSRDTRVSVKRFVGSRIEAHDVVECTRSVQYSAVFGQGELGFSDSEWSKAANAGLAPALANGCPGGIVVRGGIHQSASIQLDVPRRYRTKDRSAVLPGYLLGLALGGLLTGGRRYHLRSGCALVPSGAPEWRALSGEGEPRPVELDAKALLEELRDLAEEWANSGNVTLGGEPTVHRYDPARAKRMLKAKTPKAEQELADDDDASD